MLQNFLVKWWFWWIWLSVAKLIAVTGMSKVNQQKPRKVSKAQFWSIILLGIDWFYMRESIDQQLCTSNGIHLISQRAINWNSRIKIIKQNTFSRAYFCFLDCLLQNTWNISSLNPNPNALVNPTHTTRHSLDWPLNLQMFATAAAAYGIQWTLRSPRQGRRRVIYYHVEDLLCPPPPPNVVLSHLIWATVKILLTVHLNSQLLAE